MAAQGGFCCVAVHKGEEHERDECLIILSLLNRITGTSKLDLPMRISNYNKNLIFKLGNYCHRTWDRFRFHDDEKERKKVRQAR